VPFFAPAGNSKQARKRVKGALHLAQDHAHSGFLPVEERVSRPEDCPRPREVGMPQALDWRAELLHVYVLPSLQQDLKRVKQDCRFLVQDSSASLAIPLVFP